MKTFYIINAVFWLIFFIFLVGEIKRKKISIEYSISWILAIIFIIIGTTSSSLLNRFAKLVGITYPPALLVVIIFYFLVVLLFSLTKIISKVNQDKKNLMQDFLLHSNSITPNSDILIIIPVYNESKNIDRVISEIQAKYHYDILVINDGSTDNTQEIIEQLPCFNLTHSFNCGYGVALETGYKFAYKYNYNRVIQFDGDGQHDVDSIKELTDAIDHTGNDVIIGSRFLKGDNSYKPGFARWLGISLFRFTLKIILRKNYSDPTSGLQILNRRVINFYSHNNCFPAKYPDADMIILLNLNNFKVGEIPVIMHPNIEGKSMHSGFIKPIVYMIYMTLSIIMLIIFNKRRIDEGVANEY